MKTVIQRLIILFALALMGLNCDKDNGPIGPDGCSNKSWGELTKSEVDAVNSAATTFANSPSKATCENFRTAYIDYIEALEKLSPCVPAQNRQAFETALSEGKVELQELDCNQDFQS